MNVGISLKLLQAKFISINRLKDICILGKALSSILLNDRSKLLMFTMISLKSTESIKLFDKFNDSILDGKYSIVVK